MNVFKAREILELPEKYDEKLLKQNYKRLAMKYHPYKNKAIDADEKIKEINTAHDFLLKNNVNLNLFTNIFHTFTKSFGVNTACAFNLNKNNLNTACAFNLNKFNASAFKTSLEISISAKEYCLGAIKKICTKRRCICEQQLCISCGGCGFSLPSKFVKHTSPRLDICMNCTGDGYIQNCEQCDNGIVDSYTDITLGPQPKTEFVYIGKPIKLLLEKPYFIKNNNLYCLYNISLKESLTGFIKIFKDPFGEPHEIVSHGIVKSNDGYRIIINGNISIVVVFNVIYPKQINIEVTEQLSKLNF